LKSSNVVQSKFGVRLLLNLCLEIAMEEFFKLAIQNVARHGDTDVFPFPIENYIFYDKPQEAVDILKDIHSNFEQAANDYPPLRSRCHGQGGQGARS
jgi:hypothetical protein